MDASALLAFKGLLRPLPALSNKGDMDLADTVAGHGPTWAVSITSRHNAIVTTVIQHCLISRNAMYIQA